MSFIWNTLILNPIFTLLMGFYELTGNLGLAIIIFTLFVKTILIPITLPTLKMSSKQRDIQPEIKKLKEKYGHDQKKMAEMQMELFKKHGINPASGCLTTIISFIFMIAIYRAVSTLTLVKTITDLNIHIIPSFLQLTATDTINTHFLYLNLSSPDPFLIVTIIAVALQFAATKMMMPYAEEGEKAAQKTPDQTDDLMASMQKQNLYLMPVMFFIFGITLPSGVMLYIIVSTLFQIVQTYFFTGWGGLKPWINKIKSVKKSI